MHSQVENARAVLSFEVPGDPVGKDRPRAGIGYKMVKGRKVVVPVLHSTQKTKDYEAKVGLCAKAQMLKLGLATLGEAVGVEIRAYHPVPKSWSQKDTAAALVGDILPTSARLHDGDNIIKAILDGMNGIVYDDDHQVCACHIQKAYAERPRVEVVVRLLRRKYEVAS